VGDGAAAAPRLPGAEKFLTQRFGSNHVVVPSERWRTRFGTALLLFLVGCEATRDLEPPGRVRLIGASSSEEPARGRVLLRAVFASRPAGDTALNEDIWQPADEAVLPLDVGQALHQHGFRLGVFSGQPPKALDMILREVPEGALNGHELKLASGEPTLILLNGPLTELPAPVALLFPAGPAPGEAVHLVLRVSPTLQTDDSVELHGLPGLQRSAAVGRFVPELVPGGVRQWTLDLSPGFVGVPALQWKVRLKREDTLLLGCDASKKEVAGWFFFVQESFQGRQQVVLLLQATVEKPPTDPSLLYHDDAPSKAARKGPRAVSLQFASASPPAR
jgi:hypothetical protein